MVMDKMDEKLKAAWIADLRSGPRQHLGALRSYDGMAHCCLGRLCVVAGIKLPYEGVGDVYHDDLVKLVGSVEAIYGLWRKNDGTNGERQHTFPEIADWIEANL